MEFKLQNRPDENGGTGFDLRGQRCSLGKRESGSASAGQQRAGDQAEVELAGRVL